MSLLSILCINFTYYCFVGFVHHFWIFSSGDVASAILPDHLCTERFRHNAGLLLRFSGGSSGRRRALHLRLPGTKCNIWSTEENNVCDTWMIWYFWYVYKVQLVKKTEIFLYSIIHVWTTSRCSVGRIQPGSVMPSSVSVATAEIVAQQNQDYVDEQLAEYQNQIHKLQGRKIRNESSIWNCLKICIGNSRTDQHGPEWW